MYHIKSYTFIIIFINLIDYLVHIQYIEMFINTTAPFCCHYLG